MQPTETRCPHCGKVKSATWWQQPSTAAAPSSVVYTVPQTTAGAGQVVIPLSYPAPVPQGSASYSTADFCWCGTTMMLQ